jgi:hypothetical protein
MAASTVDVEFVREFGNRVSREKSEHGGQH